MRTKTYRVRRLVINLTIILLMGAMLGCTCSEFYLWISPDYFSLYTGIWNWSVLLYTVQLQLCTQGTIFLLMSLAKRDLHVFCKTKPLVVNCLISVVSGFIISLLSGFISASYNAYKIISINDLHTAESFFLMERYFFVKFSMYGWYIWGITLAITNVSKSYIFRYTKSGQ